MDVILLQKMQNLGDLGDQVKVKRGYARNYLIPQGRAVPATPDSIAAFEAKRTELEVQQAEILAAAQRRADALDGFEATMSRKAGEEGRLFGSVGTQDIAEAVSAAGFEVTKAEVRLPAGPLRQVGDYDVAIHLHADIDATVKIHLVAQE
jgi:large subunit ribosomal protein L9